ncbi:formimidoylglutamate deiminase [Wenzhouxiangella sp. AB-CW3]|uniref:formimidoylglutamate deiminase n=1 Tax=Wenzhouxiangella sp. AB-CW3 TaxID=2771012 RepID=UPI00168BEBC9|nr:formimidoylglutamate deiminase [Wenzhouxiangella sp. AB-CW3]QOC21853.1 formimidoylglutamate deiminase [Wenzhouxiangella sp. AB-CW3]
MSEQLFHGPAVLTAEGWIEDCSIRVDAGGWITAIKQGSSPDATRLSGPVLPGMVNVHSHIHQRLIAGLTGYRAADADSFWTWREQMYRAVGMLDTEELEALASYAFMELLEGGYTSTGEFHYPHRLGGVDPLQNCRRLLGAADQAGMTLTLLPVWYRYSGFGRREPTERQRPFVMTLDELVELVGQLRRDIGNTPHRIGVAPHSLRAVDVADLPDLLQAIGHGPVHLHISEQPAEVAECREHCGQTPIDLLARHVALDDRWCLIHATHATQQEIGTMAASDAVVGLCPTTEADLGDGLFPVREFVASGGRYAIGSDSNLVVDAAAELQLLDWGQRLMSNQRNALCDGGEHLGRRLWSDAARAGADALDQAAGALAVGCRADFVVLDGDHPLLSGLDADYQLDTLVLAGGRDLIDQVWVAGQCRVSAGRHPGKQALRPRMAELRRRLVNVAAS